MIFSSDPLPEVARQLLAGYSPPALGDAPAAQVAADSHTVTRGTGGGATPGP